MSNKPLRQRLASRMMNVKHPFMGVWSIERLYTKLIFIVAGKEPYYWIHYGKNCICCERGWHS